MTRIFAVLCFCILSFSANATDALHSNIKPLAFGMSVEETANALGAPLQLIAVQRRGGETYFAQRDTRVPGYPVEERIVLQYRKGGLTGWKRDWNVRKPWLF